MEKTKRQKLEILRGQLEQERVSHLTHWRDLSDYILPRRARFTVTDANKGDRRNQKIIDSTATIAARTLSSGMMGGITSPARPWFRLTTPDITMMENGQIKSWLHIVAQRMGTVFGKSNLYNVLPTLYADLGVFGTAAMFVEEDFTDVIRCYSFPIGSYMIAKDYRGRVNTFCREFRMTVRELIEKFAARDFKTNEIIWDNFSEFVRNAYENGQSETWVDVCHIVKPNDDYNPKKLNAKFKKFSSCYFERGSIGTGANYLNHSDNDRYLRESGYDYFPVLCPRWQVTGEDVYGTSCPGMDALGDIKQLQLGEKRGAQAIEKMINPPMVAPTSLRNQKASIVAGDITYADTRDGAQGGFRPAHEVTIPINQLEGKQDQIRRRINDAMFASLFLMMQNDQRSGITAREIDERHEEKLLALGPVLEQLNQDLLDPLIDIVFDVMLRQNMIPPAPKEIAGMDLKVEYISMMAQAQKLVGISGIERFIQFTGQIAQFDPNVLKKVNSDQVMDYYADIVSVPPGIVRSDEEVAEMNAAEAQQAQQQQMMANIQAGAGAAKDLASADLSSDNALSALMKQSMAGV